MLIMRRYSIFKEAMLTAKKKDIFPDAGFIFTNAGFGLRGLSMKAVSDNREKLLKITREKRMSDLIQDQKPCLRCVEKQRELEALIREINFCYEKLKYRYPELRGYNAGDYIREDFRSIIHVRENK